MSATAAKRLASQGRVIADYIDDRCDYAPRIAAEFPADPCRETRGDLAQHVHADYCAWARRRKRRAPRLATWLRAASAVGLVPADATGATRTMWRLRLSVAAGG